MNSFKQLTLLVFAFLLIYSCTKDKENLPAPQVSEITSQGAQGDTIIIIGKNFGKDKSRITIQFNEIKAEIISLFPTEIKAIVPKGAESGKINIIVNGLEAIESEFTVIHNIWRKKIEFPGIGRSRPCTFVLNDKLYLGMGGTLKDFWEYDPAIGKWTQKDDFPGEARSFSVSFVVNNSAYVGTGLSNGKTLKDFWKYDPITDTWTLLKEFPGNERFAACAFVLNEKAYVSTGCYITNNVNNYLKDLWEYIPSTDSWIQKADFIGDQRLGATSFVLNGKAFLGTGYHNIAAQTFLNDMAVYDPIEDNWKRIPSYGEIAQSTAFVIEECAFMGTGYLNDDTSNNFKKTFRKYDPKLEEWSNIAEFGGEARAYAISFVLKEKAYVGMGGFNNGSGYTFFTDIWEYIP